MSGLYAWINMAEAALWGVTALIALAFAARRRDAPAPFHSSRVGLVLLAATLAAFGASDVVETYTGAWWRPWWLLAWKSGCVMVLLAFSVAWLKRRAARSDPRKPSSIRSA